MYIKLNGRYYEVIGVNKAQETMYTVEYKHSRGSGTLLMDEQDYHKRFGVSPTETSCDCKPKKSKPKTKSEVAQMQRNVARGRQRPLSPSTHFAEPTDLVGIEYNGQRLIGVVMLVSYTDTGKPYLYNVRVMCGHKESRVLRVEPDQLLAIIPQIRKGVGYEYQYGYDVNHDYGTGHVLSWEDRLFTDGTQRNMKVMHLCSTVKYLLDVLNIRPEVRSCYPILNG